MGKNNKFDFKLLPYRLINVRTKLGISKAEAARRLNLSKMGYGRYESGEREPSPQIIKVIAEVFGTSEDYLTGKSDDMSSDKIVIYKNDAPELFEIVEECQKSDSKMLKRLYSYFSSLNKQHL